MTPRWKPNWPATRQHYVDWWQRHGFVLSMWEHFRSERPPHEPVSPPDDPADARQRWFDPQHRAARIHHDLAHSNLEADILPVANTHLGPGSLAAILGADLEASADTIWIRHVPDFAGPITVAPNNHWWRLHLDLLDACKSLAQDRYFVGCPDLVEGLDTLAALRGTEAVLLDMALEPNRLEDQLAEAEACWFEVFDQIYDRIVVDGEMTFCYFSLWAPGRVTKLQCDLSLMISEKDFRRFALPGLRRQCQRLDYSLYHLDGVQAIRHLDALLEIDELDAIQWTPGVDQPQGGDPRWFDLYRRIRAAGKSVMACWVRVDQLAALLEAVGPQGLAVLMDFRCDTDVEKALEIAARFL